MLAVGFVTMVFGEISRFTNGWKRLVGYPETKDKE